MSFRLVPNSVTLDDLERRNSPNRRVILPNSVAFGADHYVKVVEKYTSTFCNGNVGHRN